MKKTAPHIILEKTKHEIRMKPDLAYYERKGKQECPVPRWRLDHCAARTASVVAEMIPIVARGADVTIVACAGRPRSCRPVIARARVLT